MTHNAGDPIGPHESSSASRWRISRRNVTALAAIVGAAVATNAGKAFAMARPPRGSRRGSNSNHKCFLAGTHISTPCGPVEITRLRAGDHVVTHDGTLEPIENIRSTTLSRADGGGPWPREALPVQIRRGALGDNTPHADLYVSQWHLLLLDGVLIPAGDLVNGTTIALADCAGMEELTYLHIQLAEHDAVLAEGVPCETLLVRDATAHYAMAAMAPMVRTRGGITTLTSRLRSAIAPIVDVRTRADVLRDSLEDRAEHLRAA